MRPIIKAEGVGKQYRIGAQTDTHATLRDALVGAVRSPLRWARRGGESFWALRDVGFEVQPGEVVGIIGRNGAGKSTLLKILSRVTEPTTGRIELYGRVSSLLEVGTGFHPELTGRENIFLNGAILGMGREEIRRKFDEIVAFAEIEQFLDTPVKRYSSGMYIRLAFAVAAHLESEILLVDEVLAVGDAQFQKKCLGKMSDISSVGRTVFLVSHSMASILRLCPRVILLDHGGVVADGNADLVTRVYLDTDTGMASERIWETPEAAPGNSVARLRAVRVRDEQGRVTDSFDIRKPIYVEVEYWNLQRALRTTAVIHFVNEDGTCLFASNDFNNLEWWNTPREPGLVRATCRVPGNFLAEGRISVLAAVCTYNPDIVQALERDAISFQVFDNSEGDGVRGTFTGTWPGVVRPMLDWQVAFEPREQTAWGGPR
ncbi:MAG TPA: ABC transporter ATP-binding protein [Pyrinomonadaceae bacterium]|nr:ABC transporter ATP-binding protein [Pyrinomonadaceae bacterium]